SECPRRRCRCERPPWSAVDEDEDLVVVAGVEVTAPDAASGAATAGVTRAMVDARADRDAVVVGVLARAEAAGFSGGRTTWASCGPPVTSAPVAITAAAPALSDTDAAPAPPAPAATSATRATVESPDDASRRCSTGSGVTAVIP